MLTLGQCGSCWAFATTGALEAQHYRQNKKLVSLSEQNLMDCSSYYGNNGCQGGHMVRAFQYIADNGGIDSEESYAYERAVGACRYDTRNSAATAKGFANVNPSGDEDTLKKAVATIGPSKV